LITQLNIEYLLKEAKKQKNSKWFSSQEMIFPHTEFRKSSIILDSKQLDERRSREINFNKEAALKEEKSKEEKLQDKVKLFMKSLFCTRRLPPKVEPNKLPPDKYRIFTPGRSSRHKEDIEFCTHFCEHFNKLAERLQLDGYYAPKIYQTPGVDRGLHEEVMLCRPYDKIKLIYKIPIGTQETSRTLTGTVKNSLGVKKEVAARERIKQIATRDRLFRKRKLSLELSSNKR
jgi:hypothetical protein